MVFFAAYHNGNDFWCRLWHYRIVVISKGTESPHPKKRKSSPGPTVAKWNADFKKKSASDWVDTIKERSTLTGLVEPAGVTIGILSDPITNLKTLADGGSALLKGDFGEAGSAVSTMVDRAYNPDGIGGKVYASGTAIKALTGAAVGGLEIYAGIESDNKYMVMMGAADLVGAGSNVARMANLGGVSLGLSLASTLSKTALVLARPKEFSRTQKMKTILDGSGSVASTMMQNGILVGPALGISAVAGLGQMAYMNHPGFRKRVDGLIDKIIGKRGKGLRYKFADLQKPPNQGPNSGSVAP